MNEITARFEALVRGPEPAVPLDEVALLVAAHANPSLDIGTTLTALDELAARCDDATFGGIVEHLRREGFAGNRGDYYDPHNSFLDQVVERRTGIPITLSIVAIEVGRRLDVPIVGVGLPGHFLVRDALDTDAFADVFDGRLLSRADCVGVLAAVDASIEFADEHVAPVGTRAIVARLLANLKGIYLTRRDRRGLAWVLGLRVAVPGVPLEEHRELASALASGGDFAAAAAALDRMGERARAEGRASLVDEAEAAATRLRARLN